MDADLIAENSIDALVAQLSGQICRVEFGTYETGNSCWAYVWVNGEGGERQGEGEGETFAEAIRNAIEVA